MRNLFLIFCCLSFCFQSCLKTHCGHCKFTTGQENGKACSNDKATFASFQTQCKDASGVWVTDVVE